jgi:hypothetical protein
VDRAAVVAVQLDKVEGVEAMPLSSQATASPSMMQLSAQTGQRIYN